MLGKWVGELLVATATTSLSPNHTRTPPGPQTHASATRPTKTGTTTPTCLLQHLWRRLPWLVYVLCRQLAQHRQPAPHIVAVRVKALPLLLKVDQVAEGVSVCNRSGGGGANS